MIMKNLLYATLAIFIFSLTICSCGESDEIKSGKINACLLKCAVEELKADPENEELIKKVAELQSFVEINRETASDKDAFDEAIAEHLKNDCECK